MTPEERAMYEYACALTLQSGALLQELRRNGQFEVMEKTSQMDLVTGHDLYMQRHLVQAIAGSYPGHGFLAEEENLNRQADQEGYCWIIDPIDGTLNYYRFGKDYAISLALYRKGEPVFGLVYDVDKDMLFSSVHGEGAFVNRERFQPRPAARQEDLRRSVVAISLRTMGELNGLGMDVLGMLSGVQAHRYLGCASLELCKVAGGEYDLFISANVYASDIAAAGIFLKECGGTMLCRNKDREGMAGGDAGDPGNSGDLGCGKLLVAAFRSPAVWEEALAYFPLKIKRMLV